MPKRDSQGNLPSSRRQKRDSRSVRFTKEQFEAALPTHNETKAKLWEPLGVIQGEQCYAVIVRKWVRVIIRSSVRGGGISAGDGEDSIRMMLEVFIPGKNDEVGSWVIISGGPDAWTQRTIGWEERMRDKIRAMWSIGREIVTPPKHGDVVRMAGTSWNKGRIFANDMSPGNNHTFRWLDRCPHVKTKFDKDGALSKEYKTGLMHYAAQKEGRADLS